MDSEYIKDNNIATRYLRGLLTPEESIEFEEYLIDKPELIEQLEIDAQLMNTLPEVSYTAKQPKTLKTLFTWLFNTPQGASLATSFVCLLAFSLFFTLSGNISGSQQAGSLIAKQSQVAFLDTLRGAANNQDVPRTIILSTGTKSISIGVPAEPDYPSIKYKVQVSHAQIIQGQFSTGCRLADQSGYFFITLEGNPLQQGLYLIDLIPCHDTLATKQLAVMLTNQESK